MPWNKKERERERLKMCLRLMERAFVLAYERERERERESKHDRNSQDFCKLPLVTCQRVTYLSRERKRHF